jgi:hypothetical protein
MTMKTSDLTVRLDQEFGCWIAFLGGTPWDSGTIGEGSTREAAVADYWFGVHKGKTATLVDLSLNEGCWKLTDGTYVVRFATREEAVAYGEEHQYITSPFVKEI